MLLRRYAAHVGTAQALWGWCAWPQQQGKKTIIWGSDTMTIPTDVISNFLTTGIRDRWCPVGCHWQGDDPGTARMGSLASRGAPGTVRGLFRCRSTTRTSRIARMSPVPFWVVTG